MNHAPSMARLSAADRLVAPGPPLSTTRRIDAITSTGVVLSLATFVVKAGGGAHPAWDTALTTATVLLFVLVGWFAARRTTYRRTAILMSLTGLALVAEDIQLTATPAVHTVGLLLTGASSGVMTHLVLAFPSGRIEQPAARVVVAAAYLWSFVAIPIAALFSNVGGTNLLALHDEPAIVDAVNTAGMPIAAAVVVLLAHRWLVTRPALRHVLTPVLLVNLAGAATAIGAGATYAPGGDVHHTFIIGFKVAALALPLAFLVGLVRIRAGHTRLSTFVEAMNGPVAENDFLRLLREALRDPGAVVGYRLEESGDIVDLDGQRLELPGNSGDPRVITDVVHGRERVAVLIHDPAILDDAHVLRSVAAATGLAVQNQRLMAELRAQLGEVTRSRHRLAQAAQAERTRIERDLHDGLQARLVAALIGVRQARSGRLAPDESAIEDLLTMAATNLDDALADLRRITHGIRPALLAERGLVPAVEDLLAHLPVASILTVDPVPDGQDTVTDTAYFVIAEAIGNALKHSRAESVTVNLHADDRSLVVKVSDDGVGAAPWEPGLGCRSLADRVAALGGEIEIEHPDAGGTRVTARLPWANPCT